MKVHKYILGALLLLTAALQSCEKDVANFDISTTPMLVATAFISPQDTILAVEVKRTSPAIGKQLTEEGMKVTDAIVTLSDGTQTIELEYDPARNKYFASIKTLPVVANKTYFLKVTTPKGEKAEATCTVPSREGISLTELNYETVEKDNYGYPTTLHYINYKWQDASGVENYYHATSYRTTSFTFGYPPVVMEQHEVAFAENTKLFLKDEKQDGKIMQSPGFSFSSGYPDHASKPFKIIAVLAITDKAYYQYHQSILSQESTGGNPFAEPQRMYTNIQGGLGVFAAYNQIKAMKIIQ